MSGLQCFNMGHNGHGINPYGVSMTLMANEHAGGQSSLGHLSLVHRYESRGTSMVVRSGITKHPTKTMYKLDINSQRHLRCFGFLRISEFKITLNLRIVGDWEGRATPTWRESRNNSDPPRENSRRSLCERLRMYCQAPHNLLYVLYRCCVCGPCFMLTVLSTWAFYSVFCLSGQYLHPACNQ